MALVSDAHDSCAASESLEVEANQVVEIAIRCSLAEILAVGPAKIVENQLVAADLTSFVVAVDNFLGSFRPVAHSLPRQPKKAETNGARDSFDALELAAVLAERKRRVAKADSTKRAAVRETSSELAPNCSRVVGESTPVRTLAAGSGLAADWRRSAALSDWVGRHVAEWMAMAWPDAPLAAAVAVAAG